MRQLYNQTFDLELAISSDLCEVPAGWLESHAVRLPDAFRPVTKRQILCRLERMIHAPQDTEAIDAILAAATTVVAHDGSRPAKRRRLIASLNTLADDLIHARRTEPDYIDALLHGHLDRSLNIIATDRLAGLPRGRAIDLLLKIASLWMLYDLQIIAARLHKSIYRPTDGFIEPFDAGPQSLQSIACDRVKMGEMAEIASRLQNRKPGHITPTDQADERRFWGFVTSTEFKSLARQVGLEMGFTAAELDDVDAGRFGKTSKIAKVLRQCTAGAASIGSAFQQSLKTKWNDRAPTGKSTKLKSEAHLSVSSVRYGIDAPAALAHAIVAFIELSEQLPNLIQRDLGGDRTALREPLKLQIDTRTRDHKVTFERMFAAYRAIFLRDTNHLREELREMLPRTTTSGGLYRSPIFASNAAAQGWRRDFILGRISTVGERLGETKPITAPEGVEPGMPTDYGAESLAKARAIIARNRADDIPALDPRLTPAILWRLTDPLPPDLPN